jgi:hypothetical protein
MIEILSILLRIAGAGLIALSILHIPIVKQLKWHEEYLRMTATNASIMKVHAFFICVLLVMMGLPALLDPVVFLAPSRAGAWASWLIAGFWFLRLYCQWFVYPADLWTGKRMETNLHWLFTFIWIALTALFTCCGLVQAGMIR